MSSRSILTLLLLSILALSLLGTATACGPSCVTGYYYLERPLFNYTSNGCGSYGVSVDAPFGANSCCTNHDYCYSNCSTTKDSCDTSFHTCLDTQCTAINGTAERDACRVQADLFYTAVMGLGCPAYTSAQDTACECSSVRNYSGNGTVYYLNSGSNIVLGGSVHAAVVLTVWMIAAVVLW